MFDPNYLNKIHVPKPQYDKKQIVEQLKQQQKIQLQVKQNYNIFEPWIVTIVYLFSKEFYNIKDFNKKIFGQELKKIIHNNKGFIKELTFHQYYGKLKLNKILKSRIEQFFEDKFEFLIFGKEEEIYKLKGIQPLSESYIKRLKIKKKVQLQGRDFVYLSNNALNLLGYYNNYYTYKNMYKFLALNLFFGYIKFINNPKGLEKDWLYYECLLKSLAEIKHVNKNILLEICKKVFKLYYNIVYNAINSDKHKKFYSERIYKLFGYLFRKTGIFQFFAMFLLFYTKNKQTRYQKKFYLKKTQQQYFEINEDSLVFQYALEKDIYKYARIDYKKLIKVIEFDSYKNNQFPFYHFLFTYYVKYETNNTLAKKRAVELLKKHGQYLIVKNEKNKKIYEQNFKDLKLKRKLPKEKKETRLYSFNKTERDWLKNDVLKHFLGKNFLDIYDKEIIRSSGFDYLDD
jgi:hypothetical protein